MGGYVPQLPQMGYAAAPPPNSAAQQYQPPPVMQQIEQQMPPAGAGMGAANIAPNVIRTKDTDIWLLNKYRRLQYAGDAGVLTKC